MVDVPLLETSGRSAPKHVETMTRQAGTAHVAIRRSDGLGLGPWGLEARDSVLYQFADLVFISSMESCLLLT